MANVSQRVHVMTRSIGSSQWATGVGLGRQVNIQSQYLQKNKKINYDSMVNLIFDFDTHIQLPCGQVEQ